MNNINGGSINGDDRIDDPRKCDIGEAPMPQGREDRVTNEDISVRRMRDVTIRQLNYGYVINIDCHSFAIENADKLLELVGKYIKSPTSTEKSWFNGTLLK